MPQNLRGKGLLTVLWAYFDESSDGRAERVFGIAGYFGDESAWHSLEEKWRSVTSNTPFHMTDCLAGEGKYKNWSRFEREHLISRLISVINEVEIYGFHAGVLLQDFHQIFPGDNQEAAFWLCFQECFGQAAKWADGLGADVAVVLDKNPFESRARRLFDHVRNLADRPGWEAMKRLASLEFPSKGERLMALEAADIISHTSYRLMNDLILKGESQLWWLEQLNSKRRLYGCSWDRGLLVNLREEVISAREAGVIPYVVKKKGEAK